MHQFFSFLFFLWFSVSLSAQTLPDIVIHDSTQIPFKPHNISLKDYAARSSLAAIIEDETGWTLKSYGGAGLATISARGSSAQQVFVEWNGLSLQNPMNGTIDFQLFPISPDMYIQAHSGGNAWLGSGAIGGVVQMQSFLPDTGFSTQIQFAAASWDRYQTSGMGSFRKKQWAFRQSIQYQNAQNRFSYYNPFLKLEQKLEHAHIQQKSSITEAYYAGEQDTISCKVWLQGTDRELAPTFTQMQSLATQADQSYRGISSWNFRRNNWKGYVSMGFLYDFLHYKDSLAHLDDFYTTRQWIAKTSLQRILGSHWVVEGLLECNTTTGWAEQYAQNPSHRQKIAYGIRIKNLYPRVQWQAGFKQEFVFPEQIIPILPLAQAQIQLRKNIYWKIGGSRTYRIPTFNDWFWQPGGNPHLLPEEGWNVETSLQGQWHSFVGLELTLYQQWVNNWIVWQSVGSYFSPQNISKVWSKGIETKIWLQKNIQRWRFYTQWQYQFCQVIRTHSIYENDPSIGKQMIYVPEHKGSGKIQIQWASIGLQLRSQFSSYRWIDPENTIFLHGYVIHSIAASYELAYRKVHVSFLIECKNPNNQRYQLMENRPMPGREWSFSVACRF